MKKWIFILAFIFSSNILLAQRIEIFGGYTISDLTNGRSNDNEVVGTREGQGYSFGTGMDFKVPKVSMLFYGFAVKLDNYGGTFHARSGGNGLYAIDDSGYRKTVIAIDLYPVNIMLFKKLRLGVGAELNYTVAAKGTGSTNLYSHYGYLTTTSYGNKFIAKKGQGIVARASFDVKFAKNWFIVPQYQFFCGLTNEFHNAGITLWGLRNNFYLGIAKKF